MAGVMNKMGINTFLGPGEVRSGKSRGDMVRETLGHYCISIRPYLQMENTVDLQVTQRGKFQFFLFFKIKQRQTSHIVIGYPIIPHGLDVVFTSLVLFLLGDK